jgi:capsular polysaccharide biosynthesis protein
MCNVRFDVCLSPTAQEAAVSLRDTIRILRRRGWVALLIAALTAAAAFGFSRMQTPVYRSSILVSLNIRPDLGLSEATKALLRNYATNMYSTDRAREVINRLQLDTTPEELKSRVTIDPDESRFIIQIDAKDYSAQVANDITRTWADVLVEWREQENQKVERRDRVEAAIVEPPIASLYTPQTRINTVAGLILGALLGLFVVFGLEWIESGVVRTPDDMERMAGMTVLGAIPTVMTNGHYVTERAAQRTQKTER